MKRLVAAAAILAGTFYAGGEVQDTPAPPAQPSPCPTGFEYAEISGDIATRTCSADPFVVTIDPAGNAVKAFDTSGRGEIPVSEVPGWE